MSLINKMLQDLDARGTPAGESFPSQIRPVAHEHARLGERLDGRGLAIAGGGAVALLAVLALAWFGWTRLHVAPPEAPSAPVAKRAPAAVQAGQGMSSTITMGPANAPAAMPAASASAVPAAVPPAYPVAATVSKAAPAAEPAVPAAAPRLRATEMERLARQAGDAPAPAPKSVAPHEPDSEEARAARQAIMAELQTRMAAKGGHHPRAGAARAAEGEARVQRVSPGRQELPSQRAENEYRRALASLQEGRMTETLAALEGALRIDPTHDAARQTLVGLLIEAGRSEEAMRHLQAGLAQDPRQPALAMLLARLQIEGGGNGIDTLQRTLPYVANGSAAGADYHAFLAGALQRAGRHREAAEQYQAALRVAPANGVWWMGLGMSLQAQQRNAEALDAFQRARASGSLNGELQGFVERRVQQLGR